MKNLIRKLLFGNHKIGQYITVSLKEKDIEESVYLSSGGQNIEISKRHFCLCQDPFMVAVWLNNNEAVSTESTNEAICIEIHKSGNKILSSKCKVNQQVSFDNGKLVILELTKTKYHFINTLHQKGIIFFFYYRQKHKVSFVELDHFCAMYSYPRPVILTCFGKEDDYNLFPMDLQGYLSDEGIYLLGLRNTNVTLKKMLAAKKVVVCGIASKYKENIFALGSHHSTAPPSIDELPLDFIESETFGFPVPRIVNSYKEIEIQQSFNKGSHTIMVCKVVNEVVFDSNFKSMHHLHIATAMKLGCNYPEV